VGPGYRTFGLSIRCVAESYAITATAGVGGTILPSGLVMIAHGENKTFTFSANNKYEIEQVVIDGTNDSVAVASGNYTFSNVTENHTISVSFKEKVGIETTTNYELQIYPNPTTGELRIESGELKIENVDIFDVYGRKVSSYQLITSSSNHLINISHLSAGVYFLNINTEAGQVIKKVLKE
jgi:hypothetical protein